MGKFEIKVAKNGKWHFQLKAGNGQIILSSEMYESKSACENGIASVQLNSPVDERYERCESQTADLYFVLKARNGQIVGRSDYYGSMSALENGIASVQKNAPNAEVVDA